jgi:26S proteasome regulatory subunit (ATPase 3-interacting protein)
LRRRAQRARAEVRARRLGEESESESDASDESEASYFDDSSRGKKKKKKGGRKPAAKKAPAKPRGKAAAAKADGGAAPAVPADKENAAAAAPKAVGRKRVEPPSSSTTSPTAKKSKPAGGGGGGGGGGKPLSDAQAKAAVREYMTRQNRPYSPLQVFENLHGAVKKASVPKVLEALEKEGALRAFSFGKAVVYVAAQSGAHAADQKELEALDEAIARATAALTEERARSGGVVAEVARLESEPTDAALDGELRRLEGEAEAKRARLERAAAGAELVRVEDVEKVRAQLRALVKEWRRRKNACLDMVDAALGEESTQKPREFLAEHGLETDEDAGADLAAAARLAQ